MTANIDYDELNTSVGSKATGAAPCQARGGSAANNLRQAMPTAYAEVEKWEKLME